MKPYELIRVLVVDESAYSRRTISRMLERSPLVRVVATAADGEDALRKLALHEPDLVTLDLELPRMDGFTLLRLMMQRRPTPVLVISARAGHADVFRALELGAVDFIAKPTLRDTRDLERIEQELIRKVHATRQLRMDRVRQRLEAPPAPAPGPAPEQRLTRVVAIGSSTGGPSALLQIFGAFLEPPPYAFLVAQHMPQGFTESFAERIDRLTALRAWEARDGDRLEPGSVLVAPGEAHLELTRRDRELAACVVPRGPSDKYAPSVDRLFTSAAKHVGPELLAIVLTGMGDDGRAGVVAVAQNGGQVIAESERTAVIFGMPQQAIRTGCVHQVLPLHEIAGAIGSVRSS